MKDLIEALTIFAKYIGDRRSPTCCEHDELFVLCNPAEVTAEDLVRLEQLGFEPTDNESFHSYRWG